MQKNFDLPSARENRQNKPLNAVILFLSLLLVASLFKNISYPLFWADEGMTVIGGTRVLQFGYPKVHDGKNIFYDLQHSDKELGIDPKTDAYVGGANWGMYYVAAVGVKLAELSRNIFTKTGIIRTIFALSGMAGLLLLALLGTRFFNNSVSKKRFLALFIFMEVLSIPLALHMREVRYYPLTVFLLAVVILVYARHRILKEMRYSSYIVLLAISLLLLFFTFSPAYFVLLVSIFLFEFVPLLLHPIAQSAGKSLRRTKLPAAGESPLRHRFKNVLPCLLTLIPVYPLTVYFGTFNLSEKLTKYYALGFRTDAKGLYLNNLSFIWEFFTSYDLIYLALLLKAVLLSCVLLKSVLDRNAYFIDEPKFMFSAFLSTIFVVYFFAIPRIPNPLFTRYFIPLQPILTLIIIMDAVMLFLFLSQFHYGFLAYGRQALAVVFLAFVILNISNNMQFIKGHIFELTHQYRGPLDYVIPFIGARYKNTDKLIIATNYEETSFMYYLKARVTIGFVGNNLREDTLIQPDIIVYRKWWRNFKPEFAKFLQRQPYEEISFPVMDYAVNNIPELNREPPFHHKFQTLESTDEWEKTYIFVKKQDSITMPAHDRAGDRTK